MFYYKTHLGKQVGCWFSLIEVSSSGKEVTFLKETLHLDLLTRSSSHRTPRFIIHCIGMPFHHTGNSQCTQLPSWKGSVCPKFVFSVLGHSREICWAGTYQLGSVSKNTVLPLWKWECFTLRSTRKTFCVLILSSLWSILAPAKWLFWRKPCLDLLTKNLFNRTLRFIKHYRAKVGHTTSFMERFSLSWVCFLRAGTLQRSMLGVNLPVAFCWQKQCSHTVEARMFQYLTHLWKKLRWWYS